AMGQEGVGRGRGRFALEQVDALDLDGTRVATLYDRASNQLKPHSGWQIAERTEDEGRRTEEGVAGSAGGSVVRPPSSVCSSIELRFLTPTLLKFEGKPAREPQFHVLWRNLQRRLSMLRLAHGAGRPEIDFAATIRAAEEVRLTGWSARELT